MFLPLVVLFLHFHKGVIGQSPPDDLIMNCEEGWYEFGNKCFSVGERRVTWEAARESCLDMDADLASVHSSDEQNFLTAFPLLNYKNSLWIGLNDKEKSGTHVWTDGSAFDYQDWDEAEPDLQINGTPENCIQVTFHRENTNRMGKWNDYECKFLFYYLCQMPTNPSLSNPNPKYCSEALGGGYKLYSSCYHYVSTPSSWSDAEQFCKTRYNGHLLTFQDDTVNIFIKYILRDMKLSMPLWIGIEANDPGKLQYWSSGWLLLYTQWIEGFSQLRKGDCVLRLRSGLWDVRTCDRKYSFICEVNSVEPPKLEPSVKGSYCPTVGRVWQDLGGDYCYYYEYNDVTWHEANFECHRNGGTLAGIHSEAEARSIELFIRYKHRDVFFIGLFRKYDDDWAWMDGEEVNYLAFDHGEPNNKDEKCTDLRAGSSRWNDIGCDAKRPYLCAVKKILPNVTISNEQVVCHGELFRIE